MMLCHCYMHITHFLSVLTEFKAGSEFDMAEIQKYLQSLYEYSAVLQEKLVVAQSKLNDLAMKASYPKPERQT